MANECCANCTKCLKLVRHHHYHGGVSHIEYDDFICLAFASEGLAIWMSGVDPKKDRCEVFSPKGEAC